MSAAELDAACPSGTYTLDIVPTHDPDQSIALELASPNYPDAPWLSNYAAAQQINAGADFVLEWSPWVGATTNDCIVVEMGGL